MKTKITILTISFFLALAITITAQVAKVKYQVVYNPGSGLYEAHALVVSGSLTFPSTIPYPSKFTVVVPAGISNVPFTVVQSVNPPGMTWSQNNNVYAPSAAPGSDFHAFTIGGGGGGNAYPNFTAGTDILLFTFTVPHIACESGIRCFINGVDPASNKPGMAGIDFSQAFKTYQNGKPSGVNRYDSNTGSPVVLPVPIAAVTTTPGTATAEVTGGTPVYAYLWNGGQHTATITGQNSGNYTVTVTDRNGCAAASSVTIAAPAAQVQYQVAYNQATGLYEAHALVVSGSLTYPSTIPYPSKFSLVVPASIANTAFTVVQSVNPPGMTWSQSNNVFAPAADPTSDFHAFTITGGSGPNAYPVFTAGTDILLFTFAVPHVACESGIRCFVNGADPGSAQSGMAGIDFSQAFKTYQPGVPSGLDLYQSNTGSPVVLPVPAALVASTSTTATAMVQGGTPAYAYLWNGGQTTATITGLGTGSYTVTVTDSKGCAANSSVSITSPAAQVQYQVVYNQTSGLYEAHALVVGASLTYPSTIPYASKFSVVVPASIANTAFTVVQSVNPPGMTWSQSNNVYAPAAAPGSDFHAFTINGGGGSNAYPVFTPGNDILLFTFAVPHVACESGIRCFVNGTDPNSAQPGMAGIDFTQAFKTYQPGMPSGGNRYQSNTGSPILLPMPDALVTATATTATATALGGTPAYAYQWNNGQTTATISDLTSGTYMAIVTDSKGCADSDSVIIAPITLASGNEGGREFSNSGLKTAVVSERATEPDIMNYPNPFRESTTFAYTLPADGLVKLTLTGMSGNSTRILADRYETAGTHAVILSAPGQNLTPGVYIYTLEFTCSETSFRKVNRLVVTR